MDTHRIAERIAEDSHAAWRKTFAESNPPGTQRWKEVGGESFDINVEWKHLNPLWQAKQLPLALKYVEAIAQADQAPRREESPLPIERAAAAVHEVWIQNDTWAPNVALHCPYEELPEDEKEKDRHIVRIYMSSL
jgi:hypothetical protein